MTLMTTGSAITSSTHSHADLPAASPHPTAAALPSRQPPQHQPQRRDQGTMPLRAPPCPTVPTPHPPSNPSPNERKRPSERTACPLHELVLPRAYMAAPGSRAPTGRDDSG